MDAKRRCALVRAMDLIAKSVNNEIFIEEWLIRGVADGNINQNTDDEDLEYYIQDTEFADLMDTFLHVMKNAQRDGGLYCDRVLSKADIPDDF